MQIIFTRSVFRIFFLLIGLVFFNNLPSHAQIVNKQSNWQQRCDYDIDVKLDDVKRQLVGKIKLTYTNHSPNTLREIYIHLWPNAYKNTETPFAQQLVQNGNLSFYFSHDSCKGYIDSLNFYVNGISVNPQNGSSIDIVKLILPMPLAPGDACSIETPFRVQIPKVFSRLGWEYIEAGSSYGFNVTQWFPKPAVYDANGWNPIPYLDQGEFYSEYGNFSVNIQVPSKYIVAATGIEKSKKQNSDSTTTYHYEQDSIHDFAWFANPLFNKVTEDIVLPSGRKVTSQIYYYKKGLVKSFSFTQKVIRTTLEFLGDKVGEYPYEVVTVVQGALSAGGGMEYPTITVMPSFDATTVEHEVGHNWFYGILGSNERVHPWMDEGINSFYEDWYTKRSEGEVPLKTYYTPRELSQIDQHNVLYQVQRLMGLDQAIEDHAANYTEANYGGIVYGKTAIAFDYLRTYLGSDLMTKCMRTYYNKWKFKHPLPDDIREVFEQVSQKDLSWFFNDIVGNTKTNDYAIKQVKSKDGKLYITLKNTGQITAPVFVKIQDKYLGEISCKWEGFKGKKTFEIKVDSWKSVSIDDGHHMMETNIKNNVIHNRILFKKWEPIKIQTLGFGQKDKNILFVNPILGYNLYDKFMVGAMLSNDIVPFRTLQYTIIPMYGFKTKRMVGMADITKFFIIKKGWIHTLELSMNYTKFSSGYYNTISKVSPSFYTRLEVFSDFIFDKKNKRSLRENHLKMGWMMLREVNSITNIKYMSDVKTQVPYIEFNSKDKSKLNPINYQIKILDYQKENNISVKRMQATVFGHFNFNSKKKLYYRFFGGVKSKENKVISPTNFYASGNSGVQDFTYNELMVGRNEPYYHNNIWSKQLVNRDGAIHLPMSAAFQSDSWLMAVNMEAPLPGKIPFFVFADFSIYNSALSGSQEGLYCAGVLLPLFRRDLVIYFPMLYSQSFKDFAKLNSGTYPNYFSKISFALNLNLICPTQRKYIRPGNFL